MPQETFWTLLHDSAHWEFELFIIFIVDFLIGAVIWPRIKKAKAHHNSDDAEIDYLKREVKRLSTIANATSELQEEVRNLSLIIHANPELRENFFINSKREK